MGFSEVLVIRGPATIFLGPETIFLGPDGDGFGAVINAKLYGWFGILERMPTSPECVQILWDNPKGVPIRGKYAKYMEYRFKVVAGKKFANPGAETNKGITNRFHWKSIGKPKHVEASPVCDSVTMSCCALLYKKLRKKAPNVDILHRSATVSAKAKILFFESRIEN